VTKHDDIYMD